MKILTYVLFSLPLMANGFPAEKYELAARFTGALVRGDLALGRKLVTKDVKIAEWSHGKKSLEDLATYLRRCPIKSFEGNEQLNINVLLDCSDGYHGASLQFSGDKVREVSFGPPPVIRTTAPARSVNG